MSRVGGVAVAWGVTWGALLTGCVQPTAHPLLYRLATDPPHYVYGTIHVPDRRVLALPEVVKTALVAGDAFWAEVDVAALDDPNIVHRFELSAGQTLHDVLPPAVYARTDAYFRGRGVPGGLDAFRRHKIWAVAATAVTLDFLWDALRHPTLDQKLHRLAGDAGLERGGLETIDEQLRVMDGLSIAEQIAYLERTLDQLEAAQARGTKLGAALVKVYLRGRESALLEVTTSSYRVGDPLGRRLFHRMITERNRRLFERLRMRIESAPRRSHFFAIGASHLVGPDGVLARLRRAGYTVERVQSREVLTAK